MSYVAVCHECEVKEGSAIAREFERVRVAVFRLNGLLYAMDDICPHRQGYLSEGPLEDGKAVCPLHAWRFDLKTGAMAGNEAICLKTFPVKTKDGMVHVDLGPLA